MGFPLKDEQLMCTEKNEAPKTYEATELQIASFLLSGQDRRAWSAEHTAALYQTPRVASWVSPTVRLTALRKKRSLAPAKPRCLGWCQIYKLALSNIAYVLPKYESLISTCLTLLHKHVLFELEFSYSWHWYLSFSKLRSWRLTLVPTVKPTRCTNVSNLFYFRMTLYMFRTVFPSIISSSRLYVQQPNRYCCMYSLLPSTQQYLFDKCLLLYAQSWTADDGRKDRPKHVECHF